MPSLKFKSIALFYCLPIAACCLAQIAMRASFAANPIPSNVQNYKIGVDTAEGYSSLNVWHHGPGCVKCLGIARYKSRVSGKNVWQNVAVKVNPNPTCDENTQILCPLGKVGTFKDVDWARVKCANCNQPPREAKSKPDAANSYRASAQNPSKSRKIY